MVKKGSKPRGKEKIIFRDEEGETETEMPIDFEYKTKENNKKPNFSKLRRKDYAWKVDARKTYGRILVALLLIQNLAVFTLVFMAFITNKLQDLQIVFGILVPATLGETAYMVKTIVEWLFKDINYPE